MPDGAPRGVRDLLADACARLEAAGVDTASLDARLLLSNVTGREAAWILAHPEAELSGAEGDAFEALVMRRVAREPVSHILGMREFWSLSLSTGPDVLTPRPDSETLIEAVVEHRPDRMGDLRLLDLGTGSGCLLLALLSEYPDASGLGVDISEPALRIAEANALRLGFGVRSAWQLSDWTVGIEGRFDVIVANPPYIESAAIDALEPEVARYEPRAALDGGEDGCDPYRLLFAQLPRVMKENALVFLEHGAGQSDAIRTLGEAAGFRVVQFWRDLADIDRVVVLEHSAAQQVSKKMLGKA